VQLDREPLQLEIAGDFLVDFASIKPRKPWTLPLWTDFFKVCFLYGSSLPDIKFTGA